MIYHCVFLFFSPGCILLQLCVTTCQKPILIFRSKQMAVNVDDCFQLIFEVTLGVSPT